MLLRTLASPLNSAFPVCALVRKRKRMRWEMLQAKKNISKGHPELVPKSIYIPK